MEFGLDLREKNEGGGEGQTHAGTKKKERVMRKR